MNYEALTFWWNALLSLLVGAQFVFGWLANRDRATKEAVQALEGRLVEVNERLLVIEGAVPQLAEIRNLYEALNRLNREMGELKEKLHANTRALDRVNEHLLNRD